MTPRLITFQYIIIPHNDNYNELDRLIRNFRGILKNTDFIDFIWSCLLSEFGSATRNLEDMAKCSIQFTGLIFAYES